MKKIAGFFALMFICFLIFPSNPTRSAGQKNKIRKHENKIQNHYIVVLDDSVVGERGDYSIAEYVASEMAANYRGKLKHVYKHALNGFALEMTEADAEALSQDFRVKFVEEDGIVTAISTQNNPPWGLDRIDQRDRPLSATYTYNWSGAEVRAYVIDTGIRTTHTQFGGRAANVFDVGGGNGQDCNGHGTHVAGTIGGSTYGAAKSALLRGVRVFVDCSTTTSDSNLIAGVNWVVVNHIKPAVANISLGGPTSTAVDSAVNNLINAGVTVIVAAGNANSNACNYSPSRVPAAITVGATTTVDARSSFSNIGPCLDLFAPGHSIVSTWYTSDTATASMSGTSMASPHVAGVAALYKQANPAAAPSTIRDAIVNNATTNRITGAGTGSPNRLLYSLFF